MANPFDMFDGPTAAKAGRSPNPFDMFDAAPAAEPTSGADPGALQIRVGSRPTTTKPNPFTEGEAAPPTMDAAQFEAWFSGDMSAPSAMSSDPINSPLGTALQGKADEMLVGPASAGNSALAALYNAGSEASLNLAGNAAAGVATGLGKWGGFGFSPRSFPQNRQRFDDQRAAFARQSPKSAVAGTVAGLVGGAALPGLAGAPAATLRKRALQYGVTGGLYGGASEFFDSGKVSNAAGATGIGFGLGAAGGAAIEKLAPVVMTALAPAAQKVGFQISKPSGGFSIEAEAALRQAGLDPVLLPNSLATELQRVFSQKGASPATIREAQAAEFGIPLSQGQATQDPVARFFERAAIGGGKGQKAQEVGRAFQERQQGAVLDARTAILQTLAGKRPTLDNPQAASEGIADVARRLADDNAFVASAAQRTADQALETVRGRGAPLDPIDSAATVAQGVRDAASQAKGAYREAYGEVGRIPGSFQPGALDQLGASVRSRLGPEVPIDPVLTPAAARALADLDNLPGLFGLAPGEGPNLQQAEQLRKRLVSYYGSTGQNPTDKRALGKVIDGLDQHLEDAMSIGLFGTRTALPSSRIADDFPGMARRVADDVAPANAITLPEAARGEPESLTRFLASNGGIPLDGEARAADLNRLYVPGRGTLARNNAPSWDDLRVRLTEAGFFPYGALDEVSPRDVADTVREMIRAERQGRLTYRIDDEARAGARRGGERIADENADYASQVERQARRMAIDLEMYGITARETDPATLREAAEMMLRRETDDAAEAYDRAVARRMGAEEAGAARPAPDDAPFPGLGTATAPAASSSLPIGDTAPAEAMRKARGLFREYKQGFSPRGSGDDAGLAMRKIVDRDPTPNEVASILYGGTRAGTTGLSVRIHDRLREVLPEGSPVFSAIQQGLIAKVVDGSGDVVARIDHLLRGEGRILAVKVLTAEQRAGLEAFRAGSIRARNAETALPEWVGRLSKSGFDPNRVTADLFGSGIPGARPGQASFAKGLRAFLGPESPEWSNLRQAAWLRVVRQGEALTPEKEAARIREFTAGEGKALAKVMFSGDEMAAMNRYADAVAATHMPSGARIDDGGRSRALAGQVLNAIAGAVAFKVAGAPGTAGVYGARVGQRVVEGGLSAAKAGRSFNGGAPSMPMPPPGYTPRLGFGTAKGAGLLSDNAVSGRR